mgnify:CR=1 FL=1
MDKPGPIEPIGLEALKGRKSQVDLMHPPPVDSEQPLQGEEWMMDPKIQVLFLF